MKRLYFAALMMASLPLAAQETYEVAEVSTQDLNGTARYVGVGGAMEALGADISTMSTNPAGIGLFRKSQLSASLGLVSQQGEESFASANKTNVSFDQMGFVIAMRTSKTGFFNVGFNYHKSRNFNQILSVADRLDGASQSKLTLDKFAGGYIKSSNDATYSQVDVLYHEGLYDTNLIDNNGTFNTGAARFNGDNYQYRRGNYGYIGEYDINLSGNINNRVYLGFTIGIHDVNYRGHSVYDETLQPNAMNLNTATLDDSRNIDGTGVDFKAGVIFRPIAESPFRVGLYLNTPTFYKLTSRNGTSLLLNDQKFGNQNPRYASYEYEYRTPWKFGASLGHTVDNFLALGATFEYTNYGATDARIIDGSSYDWWTDSYYSSSSSDASMNDHIKQTLKGVATVKVGAEFKPDKDIAVRVGYNHVTPMYKKDASRGVDVWSLGNYNSSSTEYINWQSTNRLTLGLGFGLDNWKIDLAYQYSMQKGQFLPFAGSADDNLPFDKTVNNNRHQWMATVSYTF